MGGSKLPLGIQEYCNEFKNKISVNQSEDFISCITAELSQENSTCIRTIRDDLSSVIMSRKVIIRGLL